MIKAQKIITEEELVDYLEAEEVAKKLDITRKGVFYLVGQNKLTPNIYEKGQQKKFYFSKTEVDDFRKSRKQKQKYKEEVKVKRLVKSKIDKLVDKKDRNLLDNNEEKKREILDNNLSEKVAKSEVVKFNQKNIITLVETFQKSIEVNTLALQSHIKIIQDLKEENEKLKLKLDQLSIQDKQEYKKLLPAKNKLRDLIKIFIK